MVPKLDDVAGDVRAEGKRGHAVQRAPAARLAQQLGQDPRIEQGPGRQQHEGMRDAAVREQVLDRAKETDHEVEVGRGTGEEAGGDAPRQRARWCIPRCGGPREQRSGERVGQRVQSGY